MINKNWLKIGSINLRKDLLPDIVMIDGVEKGDEDFCFEIWFKFEGKLAARECWFDNIGTAWNRKSKLQKEIDEAVKEKEYRDCSFKESHPGAIEFGSDNNEKS